MEEEFQELREQIETLEEVLLGLQNERDELETKLCNIRNGHGCFDAIPGLTTGVVRCRSKEKQVLDVLLTYDLQMDDLLRERKIRKNKRKALPRNKHIKKKNYESKSKH